MATKPDVTHVEPEAQAFKRHKPEYSDMCPICGPRIERGRNITRFHKSFVEFGYSALTRDETAAAYDAAVAGKPDPSAGIIATLIRSQLEEAGLV